MADADPIASKEKKYIDAVKKAYAVSDAVHDVTTEEIIGEDRETILNLLSAARDLAIECGCIELVDEADKLRIQVAGDAKTDEIRAKTVKLTGVAKTCLESLGQVRALP